MKETESTILNHEEIDLIIEKLEEFVQQPFTCSCTSISAAFNSFQQKASVEKMESGIMLRGENSFFTLLIYPEFVFVFKPHTINIVTNECQITINHLLS